MSLIIFYQKEKFITVHNALNERKLCITKINVLGNIWIYTIQYNTIQYNKHYHLILLGVANVWNERKGLDDFIEISKLLPQNIEIVLVGLKKKQIKKLPSKITGIERTNNQVELAELYFRANIFINPTYEDTFPTTNLEALACGTPVITYETGGSVESVSEETGIVVEQGNMEQLLSAIQEILKKGKSFYSENCRKRAVELYNKDERFQDYIELYNQVMVE